MYLNHLLVNRLLNLEKELGHKLFHRLGARPCPRKRGDIFLERARRILFEVEDAAKELSDSPSLERQITVGAIQTLAPYLLPALIARCRKRYPNLQVNIQEDFRTSLINGILEGELDLALVALPVKDDPRLHVEPCSGNRLLLVVGKDHPLAQRKQVTAADLAHENFVMMGTASSLAQQVRSFCGDHHFEPRLSYRCSQVPTVKALVALGAGVSILPRMARAPEDDASLVYITLSDAKPYPRTRRRPPHAALPKPRRRAVPRARCASSAPAKWRPQNEAGGPPFAFAEAASGGYARGTMIDLIKKSLLAGVGAAVVTKEKVEQAFDEFVKEGKVSAARCADHGRKDRRAGPARV